MLLLLPLVLNSVFGTLSLNSTEPERRIVGGQPTTITERPFQVLILRKTPELKLPGCGGAIITHRWVVTAAHCIAKLPVNETAIRAGTDVYDDDTDAVWYKALRSVVHPTFNGNEEEMTNDIGMLMTDSNIVFGPRVALIPVRTKTPKPSTPALVSGFGVVAEGEMIMSSKMKEVWITVIDHEWCEELLANITTELIVSDTHFCAAYLGGGEDACQGDSGGPVTIGNSLAGVVSWGIGCGHKMVPAFYTDISQFVPWMRNVTKTYNKPVTRTHNRSK